MQRKYLLAGAMLIGGIVVARQAVAATLFSIEAFDPIDCGTLLYAGSTYAFDQNAVSVASLALAWLIAALVFWPWGAMRTTGQRGPLRRLTVLVFGLSVTNVIISLYIFPHGRSMVWVFGSILAWLSAASPAAACLGPGVPNGYWAVNAITVGIYLLSFVSLLVFQWRVRRNVPASLSPTALPASVWRPALALAISMVAMTVLELTILILNRFVASGRYDRFFFS